MKYLKTEAIILDTADVFEADRSLLLFTRELGKLRARARGVRKPTSRLTGHLLQYIPTELELHGSDNGSWTVTGAQVLSRYVELGSYPDNALLFSQQAAILVEAISKLYNDQEAHPSVYGGLAYTLDRLRALCEGTGDAPRARLVAAEFIMKALSELGYEAQLKVCVLTGQPVSPDFIGWSSQLGGVLSEEGFKQSAGTGRRVQDARAIVLLRQFLRPEFTAERVAVTPEAGNEAMKLVYDYVQTQIGQPLRSLQGQ